MTLRHARAGFGRIARRFSPYLREHKIMLAGSFLALLAEVGFRLLEPWPIKFIFDALFHGKSKKSWFPALDQISPDWLILGSALAIVVVTGLRALADYASVLGFTRLGSKVVTQLRHDLYRHLHRLSLGYHSRIRSGDLIVRLMGDVNLLKDVSVNAAIPLLSSALVLVSTMVVMFLLHWRLALVAFMLLPGYWLWTSRLGTRIRESAREQRKRESAMAGTAGETMGAIRVVQTLAVESYFEDRFDLRSGESQGQDLRSARLSALLVRSVGFVVAISTAVVLAMGANLVRRGEMTPGQLIVFLTYLKQAFRPLREFAKYTSRIAKGAAAGERVLNVLDQEPEVQDLPGAIPAPVFRGEVSFRNVRFGYRADRPILRGLDLTIEAGRRVAIVGASGNGKSTLASLISRLHDPDEGEVLIDGRDVREFTLASLRKQISVVPQDTTLFALSAHENIALGVDGASEEDVVRAARAANAHDFIMALPEGYGTILGERGATLSGGQRQRIAIARAAIRNTPVLILDEPTTGLDEENERIVLEALERLSRGRTTIIITHDLGLAAGAELIIHLEHGRVLESGAHKELLLQRGPYAGMATGSSKLAWGI